MRYDFDMHSIFPDEVQKQFQGMFSDLGVTAMTTKQVALWRDPAVVEALRRADAPVRQLFLDAGFGINCYDSGAPVCRYPARDEAARNRCIAKLAEALKAHGPALKGVDWGGLELAKFLEYLVVAQPIDEVDIAALAQVQARAVQTRKRSTWVLRLGLALMAVPAIAWALGAMG